MNILSNSTRSFATGFVLCVGITIGCSSSDEIKTFAIDSQKVTAISASISNHPDQLSSVVSNDTDLNIEEFKVPSSLNDEILGLLQGAKPHQSEKDWAVLGQLKITTQNGVHVVPLFSAGKMFIFDVPNEPGLNGGKYEANDLDKLIQAITDAKKATQENSTGTPTSENDG